MEFHIHSISSTDIITRELTMVYDNNALFTVRTHQTWGQVHEYLYLNTCKYTFVSTCTLLKYFLECLYLYPSTTHVLEYLKVF